MGQIDEYLQSQVTPRLLPGEQIMGMGCVRRPVRFNALQVPQQYEEWLATATNMRLVLFRTEQSGLFNVLTVRPKPMCLEVVEWWYQDLKQVMLGTVNGIGSGVWFGPIPHEPLGPCKGEGRRYDIFPNAEGLDAHAQFYQQYRTWISQQVAAGAFPMDEQRKAAIAAHQEAKRQEEARRAHEAELRRRARSAAWQKAKPYVPAVIVALIGASIVVVGGICTEDFSSRYGYRSADVRQSEKIVEFREADLAARKAGTALPSDCPETELRVYGKDGYCHGCNVETKWSAGEPKPGWAKYERGSSVWMCPPAAEYAELVTDAKKDLDRNEGLALGNVIWAVVSAIGTLFGLVVVAAGGLLAVLALRKVKKAAVAAAHQGPATQAMTP